MRLAIIPARGRSKRIPRKNLLPLAGVPLVAHSIRHARAATLVDEVIVSTDDPEIADVARAEGALVVVRPPELADDMATSESALLHVLDDRRAGGRTDPDLVVFLQCTSPVRTSADVDVAIFTLEHQSADSLLSVAETKRFVWRDGRTGPKPVNYDYKARRREQDFAPHFEENGSIYLFQPWVLRRENNRLGGRIALFTMDYWSRFQIDSPEDLELCEWILGRRKAADVQWPSALQLVVFDFDGVMTDGRVIVDEHGGEAVVCSRRDGFGLERLREAGVSIVVVSKERNPVVAARCRKLQVLLAQGIDDKLAFLTRYLTEKGILPSAVAYVGDDVNDLACLQLVGLPVVVADAHPAARRAAALVLESAGGFGAVREFCDLVLQKFCVSGEKANVISS